MNSVTLTISPPQLSSLEIQQRRAAAERFIEQSGDGVAMRALGGLRRDPNGWFDRLKAAATSQTTLKVALGVFMGVIAAETALALLRSDALDAALRELDAALADGVSDTSAEPFQLHAPASFSGNTSLGSDALGPLDESVEEFGGDVDLDSAIDAAIDSLLG
jgi:hypothetical protein